MRKGEQTKDRIVAEAIQLMAKHGFHDTSFQRIADACEISQSACLKHFPSKMALVRGVMEKIIQGNHDFVSASIGPRDGARTRLGKHFEGNLRWAIHAPAHAQITLLLYYLASYEPTLRDLYLALAGKARERVTELLFAAQREKELSPEAQPKDLATTLYDFLLGSFVAFVAEGKSEREIKGYTKRWDSLLTQVG